MSRQDRILTNRKIFHAIGYWCMVAAIALAVRLAQGNLAWSHAGQGDASDYFVGAGSCVLGRICGNQTRHRCLDWKNPENGACCKCSVFDMGCFLVYKITGGEFPDSSESGNFFCNLAKMCCTVRCQAVLWYRKTTVNNT